MRTVTFLRSSRSMLPRPDMSAQRRAAAIALVLTLPFNGWPYRQPVLNQREGKHRCDAVGIDSRAPVRVLCPLPAAKPSLNSGNSPPPFAGEIGDFHA